MDKFILLAVAVGSIFLAKVAMAQDMPLSQTMPQSNATQSNAAQANISQGVKCYGINGCKGKSACQTSANGCGGKNACKGQGYLMIPTQQECITKGGSLTEIPGPSSPPTAASQG